MYGARFGSCGLKLSGLKPLNRGLATKVRPSCPLYLSQVGDQTRASFSSNENSVPIGSFPTARKDYFLPAFTTDPDPFEVFEVIAKPDEVAVDKNFWPRASQALKRHIHECPVFSGLAVAETKSPFFHIFDLRCPPPIGRIPEVEDILGTVEVADGKIVPQSFEANAMYRPVTRQGAIVVSPEMAAVIAKAVDN